MAPHAILVSQPGMEPEPPCSGNSESLPLDHQGGPSSATLNRMFPTDMVALGQVIDEFVVENNQNWKKIASIC